MYRALSGPSGQMRTYFFMLEHLTLKLGLIPTCCCSRHGHFCSLDVVQSTRNYCGIVEHIFSAVKWFIRLVFVIIRLLLVAISCYWLFMLTREVELWFE